MVLEGLGIHLTQSLGGELLVGIHQQETIGDLYVVFDIEFASETEVAHF